MGADADDHRILDFLVTRHPAMVPLSEVLTLEGVDRPREAIARLRADGLVSQLGELVGTTLTFVARASCSPEARRVPEVR